MAFHIYFICVHHCMSFLRLSIYIKHIHLQIKDWFKTYFSLHFTVDGYLFFIDNYRRIITQQIPRLHKGLKPWLTGKLCTWDGLAGRDLAIDCHYLHFHLIAAAKGFMHFHERSRWKFMNAHFIFWETIQMNHRSSETTNETNIHVQDCSWVLRSSLKFQQENVR